MNILSSEPVDRPTEPPALTTEAASLAEQLEKLLKTAGLLALFGYMAVRAQLNYLGITLTSSLGLEGYLRETYVLVTGLFFEVLLALTGLLALGLLCLAPAGALYLGIRRQPSLAQWVDRVGRKLETFWQTAWAPGLLLVLSIAFLLWILRSISLAEAEDVAVGPLHVSRLQPLSFQAYTPLLCACLAGFLLWSWNPLRRGSGPAARHTPRRRVLWKSFASLLLILALHIPILQGYTRSTRFPLAAVQMKEGPPVCGLLLFETSSHLVLWHARRGSGEVRLIPLDEIQTAATGALTDLLELGRAAAADKNLSVPDCTQLPSTVSPP